MGVWGYFGNYKYHDIDNKVESPIKKAVKAKTVEGSLKHLNRVRKYLWETKLYEMHDQKLYNTLNECHKLLKKVHKTNATKREVVLTRIVVKAKLMKGVEVRNTGNMMFGQYHIIFILLGTILGIAAAVGVICMFLAFFLPFWDRLDKGKQS